MTRALITALRGDDKMSEEDTTFVRDVLRRYANADAERLIAFTKLLLEGS